MIVVVIMMVVMIYYSICHIFPSYIFSVHMFNVFQFQLITCPPLMAVMLVVVVMTRTDALMVMFFHIRLFQWWWGWTGDGSEPEFINFENPCHPTSAVAFDSQSPVAFAFNPVSSIFSLFNRFPFLPDALMMVMVWHSAWSFFFTVPNFHFTFFCCLVRFTTDTLMIVMVVVMWRLSEKKMIARKNKRRSN